MKGHNSFFIFITTSYNKKAFKKIEGKYSKRQKYGYEGPFSALYVLIEVLPSPHLTCPLQLLPPLFNFPSPLFGIGPVMITISVITPPPSICTHTRRAVML